VSAGISVTTKEPSSVGPRDAADIFYRNDGNRRTERQQQKEV
jgi:hypothetical protein